MRKIKCQDCGKEGEDVKLRKCPFDLEIHNEITWIIVCEKCEDERYFDI